MNITDTIDPKVDQLTADHLVGRTMTIRITSVQLTAGDQPCEIHYEGENGLPYRPGKSMRRVLVHAWGGDANKYAGRSLRLYRDDDVQFGGLKVGGIRISHMSDIPGALTLALTAKKGSKKAYKVLPLPLLDGEKAAPPPAPVADKVAAAVDAMVARMEAAPDMLEMAAITSEPAVIKQRTWLAANRPEMAARVDDAMHARLAALSPAEDDTGEAFSE